MTASHLSITAAKARKTSQVISHIYHFTQGGTTADFCRQALAQLAELIDIDWACWLVFTEQNPITAVADYRYGNKDDLSAELMARFNTLLNDQSLDQQSLRCGDTIIYQTANDDMQQQMLALHQHDHTRHLIVLNRKSSTSAFSDSQRVLLNFVTDSLVNAFHHSLQTKLARHWRYWRSHKAMCDQDGYIITAQDGFITTLQANLADWDGRQLPDKFEPQQLPHKFKHKSIKINVAPHDGFYVAEAYHFDEQIELLTRSELHIVELLFKAKTNKEMAQLLSTKEKTIDNHLQNIFTKLAVKSRTAVLTKLKNSDYRFDDCVAS